jgi:hypothetical protein
MTDYFTNGYLVCFICVICLYLQLLFTQQNFFLSIREGIRCKCALQVCLICCQYDKAVIRLTLLWTWYLDITQVSSTAVLMIELYVDCVTAQLEVAVIRLAVIHCQASCLRVILLACPHRHASIAMLMSASCPFVRNCKPKCLNWLFPFKPNFLPYLGLTVKCYRTQLTSVRKFNLDLLTIPKCLLRKAELRSSSADCDSHICRTNM